MLNDDEKDLLVKKYYADLGWLALDLINDVERAVLAKASQKSLDGFVIVPIEPSTEQQTAGAQAVRIDTTAINKLFTANRVYRDMIAAAPKPEEL